MGRSDLSPTLRARILIARPDMADPRFSRTVIYLLEHDVEGAIGVVINRPTRIAVAERLPSLATVVSEHEVFSEGGPVASSSVIALGAEAGGAPTIIDLDAAASTGARPPMLRLFAGYAGWGAGQLDSELLEGSWIVARAARGPAGHAVDVFCNRPEDLWRELLRREPPPLCRLALYPDDLSAN